MKAASKDSFMWPGPAEVPSEKHSQQSVKKWVNVFVHVDIRHQLIQHFLSTIS